MLLGLLSDPRACGPYNMTSPRPVTNSEFTRALAVELRRPAPFRIPGALLRLLMGERACLLLGGQKAMPRRISESGFRFRFPTAEGALKDIVGK
jgi:NAD dependent epimerase/dehydratase family enzyme